MSISLKEGVLVGVGFSGELGEGNGFKWGEMVEDKEGNGAEEERGAGHGEDYCTPL